MPETTITIIGTGAVGTSFGLALKKNMKSPPILIGHDRDREHSAHALRLGAFDKTEWNLINACDRADLIILAIPPAAIPATFQAIANDLKEGVIITDTARVKAPVLAWARQYLPPHAHFVGGDPIVFSEGEGPDHASADLFQFRFYCLTPAVDALAEAVARLNGLVEAIGAVPFFLDPEEHDGLLTDAVYLPSLISLALMNTASEGASWRDMRKLAASMFEQTTAGAALEPESHAKTLLANRANLSRAIDDFIIMLKNFETFLADEDEESLLAALKSAAKERALWLNDLQSKRITIEELPSLRQPERRGLFRRFLGMGR